MLQPPTSPVDRAGKKHKGGEGPTGHMDVASAQALDQQTLRFLVMCRCHVSMLESPWFLDLLQGLNPSYPFPGDNGCH
jgi:hypothetical protein